MANRRSFVRRAGAFLGMFGLGSAASAEAAPQTSIKRTGEVAKHDDVPLFSSSVVHGGLVYVAGKGAHYEGDIKAHTDTVLKAIEEELKKAGSSMDKVLKVNVYLADLADYHAMNEVYRGRFGENPPVRTTVATYGGVPGGSLVEIDCIAAL